MKNFIFIIIVGLVFLAVNVVAEEGKTTFSSLHCGTCHKLDTGKFNPSLREIAQGYQGKEERLISFFKGESEAIIRPDKGAAMKRYIEKTKALSDSDRKALADYLLSLKE
jgi:cytochrome c551/c552